tara:strand:+ start:11071 stop:12267 length:1197 start_codon:yes stop_codon:yes gene_type:complete
MTDNIIQNMNLKNQRVLLRLDLNVPIENDLVIDDFRVRASVPTIQHCLDEGASVVIMTHLGRPNGKRVKSLSALPVGETLADILEKPIKFSDDCVSEDAVDVSKYLMPGEIHLMENLRFHKGETENDAEFCRLLSMHGTVFINDAFGMAHREHASNVGVTKFFQEKGLGFLIQREVKYLSSILNKPKRPLTIVFGGAKIDTKLSLIKRFIKEADDIIIGGGMAFTFLKAMGKPVGNSLVQDELLETAKTIISKVEEESTQIHFPEDFIVSHDISGNEILGGKRIDDMDSDDIGVDIGSRSVVYFSRIIDNSATVIWNGPMGIFENINCRKGTIGIARSIAKLKDKDGISVIGGGDTAAAIKMADFEDKMTHVSTGGGASLGLLSGKQLPAISAIIGGI